jgi:hypothetical protein
LVGSFAQVFDLISSEYGWSDDEILDKTLRRIRQIVAAITLRKLEETRNYRLVISWQTRVLAMVTAAAGSNPSEDLMKYAANVTIDKEEFEEFGSEGYTPVKVDNKVPVHANTQETEAKRNYEAAADKNSSEMLEMFGLGVEKGKPGH